MNPYDKYLRKVHLPDSGPKEFKVGQVWVSCFDGRACIYEITGQDPRDGEGYWTVKVLAGQPGIPYLHQDSYRSRHSKLIKYLPLKKAPEPKPSVCSVDLQSWDTLTDAQKADLISVATRARQQAIDDYNPRWGIPMNTTIAITEAVVRAFSAIRDGDK